MPPVECESVAFYELTWIGYGWLRGNSGLCVFFIQKLTFLRKALHYLQLFIISLRHWAATENIDSGFLLPSMS